jgi:hypothetical protein
MTMLQLIRRSIKQFLAQKSITELEHIPHSPDLALNDFCLFPEIKSAFKGQRLRIMKTLKKCDDALFHNSRVPKMFPTVTA